MAFLGLRLATSIAVLIALGWMVVSEFDRDEFINAVTSVSSLILLLAAIAALSGSLLAVWRWKLLLVDTPLSIWRLYAIQHTGIAVGHVTSVRGIGAASQFAILTLRHRVSSESAISSILSKRLLDILVTIVAVGTGVLLIGPLQHLLPHFLSLAAWALFGWMSMLFLAATGRWFVSGGKSGITNTLARMLSVIGSNPRNFLLIGLGSFICRALVGLALWLVALAFSVDLPFMPGIIIGLAILFVAGSIPTLPASIGLFEVAGVYLLGLMGVQPEEALGIAIIYHVISLIPTAVVVLLVLPKEGFMSAWLLSRRLHQAVRSSSPDYAKHFVTGIERHPISLRTVPMDRRESVK